MDSKSEISTKSIFFFRLVGKHVSEKTEKCFHEQDDLLQHPYVLNVSCSQQWSRFFALHITLNKIIFTDQASSRFYLPSRLIRLNKINKPTFFFFSISFIYDIAHSVQ